MKCARQGDHAGLSAPRAPGPRPARRLRERGALSAVSSISRTFSRPPAELHGHAEVEALEAVLALEVRGAREDAASVAEDRLGHHHGGGAARSRRYRC